MQQSQIDRYLSLGEVGRAELIDRIADNAEIGAEITAYKNSIPADSPEHAELDADLEFYAEESDRIAKALDLK